MGDENSIIEDSLLAKFLSGDASPEEAMMVNDWIGTSSENKLQYQQLEKAWALGSANLHAAPDNDPSWTDLKKQLKRDKQPRQSPWVYRIAAGIVIVIGVAIAAYLYRPAFTDKTEAWNSKQTSNEVA